MVRRLFQARAKPIALIANPAATFWRKKTGSTSSRTVDLRQLAFAGPVPVMAVGGLGDLSVDWQETEPKYRYCGEWKIRERSILVRKPGE